MTKELPKALVITIIVLLAILYIPFHNKYRTDYIDDAWSYSWAYNLIENGEIYDTVFGILDGDGGTSLFGRGYAYVYGVWGELTGWSRPAAYILSALFLLSSAVLWFEILRKLGYSTAFTLTFVLLMLLMESYYGVGHRLRSDAMVFFFASLSFYLFLSNRPFFSAFVLCVAVELHPYGMVGLFFIISVVISQYLSAEKEKRTPVLTKKTILLFIAGGMLGIAYYLFFHFKWLGNLASLSGRTDGNPFIGYFFKFRYSWRHWPELALIIVAMAFFFIRKEYRKDKLIPVFMAMMILFSILLPRGNFHYVVFLYPPFLMLLLYTSERLNILALFMVGFLFFQIPQYTWLFWNQRDFSWKGYMERIEESVPEGKDIFVYGPSSAWFALYDRDFHAHGYFKRAGLSEKDMPEVFYILDNGKADLDKQNYRIETILSWEEPGLSLYTLYKWSRSSE